MEIADLCPGKAMNLAGRTPDALNQPGIRRKFLNPGKSVDVFDLIQNRRRQDRTDAINAPQKIVVVGIVNLHRPFDVALQVLYDQIEVVEELQVRLHVLPHRRDREVLGDPLPVLLPVQPPPGL